MIIGDVMGTGGVDSLIVGDGGISGVTVSCTGSTTVTGFGDVNFAIDLVGST